MVQGVVIDFFFKYGVFFGVWVLEPWSSRSLVHD